MRLLQLEVTELQTIGSILQNEGIRKARLVLKIPHQSVPESRFKVSPG